MAGNELEGKIAIITGGSRGLGREMAIGFAGAGAAGVTITAAPGSDEQSSDLKAERDETLAAIEHAGGKGLTLLADVADEKDCRRVVAETVNAFGTLHILVNNAGKAGRYAHGGNSRISIFEADPGGFREVIDTNILGPFLMAHAATKQLMDVGWGRIINISKRVDSMHQSAITPYGPSKAALEAATIAWAEALYGSGVTVNSLSPGGAVNTKFGTGEITGRGLDPKVIVPMAVWLGSTAADNITGCRYTADRWDGTLPPDEAAEVCRERAIFPVPTRETPLNKAWAEPGA
jgi:3-oxoacyl-[acyl-carrier protein] reductase